MMRLTVDTQPQIIVVACCITLRRSACSTAGNIRSITKDGTVTKSFGYTNPSWPDLLTSVTANGTTFGYAYDTAGNIRSITKDGTVTKSFGYTNPSWPDLLTSVTANGTTKDVLYEGQSQTSDLPSSGNPITYYNGKDYTFTWTKGRQLASATVDGKQVSYTYDMSGVRTSKTVNGTTYNYTTLSGKVMRQQWGSKSLEFVYDDGNQPFAMIYNDGSTSTLYYYVLNAQGDVIALLNSAGTLVASYNYGAWGNYSVHGADGKKTTDATFIGHINPLRYRGYYYDRETRLYYLQSRYYDFANCRFINADTFATTDANGFLSANMFAYCENNPIMRVDHNGESWEDAAKIGLVVAAVGLAALAIVSTGGGALLLAGAGISVTAATSAATATVAAGITVSAGAIIGSALEKSISRFSPNYEGRATYNNKETKERIEYEYYGNGNGNVHYEVGRTKKQIVWRLENGREKWFRVPRSTAKRLSNPQVGKAIRKAIDIVRLLSR